MKNTAKIIWIIALTIALVIALAGGIRLLAPSGGDRGERGAGSGSRTAALGRRLTETGPMAYFANDPHKLNDREYQFNYKLVGNSWRAYIVKMPSLEGRDPSGLLTHRLYENGQAYIRCEKAVSSLKEMQMISRVWADGIQEYIATGKRFG